MRLAALALLLCVTSALLADDVPASSKTEVAPAAPDAAAVPTKVDPVAAAAAPVTKPEVVATEVPPVAVKAPAEPAAKPAASAGSTETEKEAKPRAASLDPAAAKPAGHGSVSVAPAPMSGLINPAVRLREITVRMEELKKQLHALRIEQHDFIGSLDPEAGMLMQPEIDEVTKELKSLLQERIKLRKETRTSDPAKAESEPIRSELSADPGGIRIELTFSRAGDFVYVGPPSLVLSKLTKLRDSGRLNAREKAKLEPIIEDVRKIQEGSSRNELSLGLRQNRLASGKTSSSALAGLTKESSKTRTAEEEKIQKSLDRIVSLKFDRTPLSEVVRQIGTLADCNVFLDAAGLEDVGQSAQSPVTIGLDGISLRNSLHVILEPLQLVYRIDNEVLKITSQRRVVALGDVQRKKTEEEEVIVDSDVSLHKLHERLVALNEAGRGLESIGLGDMASQLTKEVVKVKQQIAELHRKAAQKEFDTHRGLDSRSIAREEVEEFMSRKRARSKRSDDDDDAPLMQAVRELRNEVRETRKDVAELRKMIEGMKTSATAVPMITDLAASSHVPVPAAAGMGLRIVVPDTVYPSTSGIPLDAPAAIPAQPPVGVFGDTPVAPIIKPLPAPALRGPSPDPLLTPSAAPSAPAATPMIPGPGAGSALPLPAAKFTPGAVAPQSSSDTPGTTTATEGESSQKIGAGVTTPMVRYHTVTEVREIDSPSGKFSIPVTRMVAVPVPASAAYVADDSDNMPSAPAPRVALSLPAGKVANSQIEKQLKRTHVTMTMENSSLYKILMRIGAQANVRIEIDNKTLGLSGDAWKFDDRTFSINVKDMPASKALFVLLDPYGLTYVVKDGAVTITTRDGAASKLMQGTR